jgi:hypothetical protein
MPSATVTADCGLLYHYTSEEGLQGIVESDNIRATHVRFLNDYTEFRQAFQEEYVEALADAFREELPGDLDITARQVVDRILSKPNHSSILGILRAPLHRPMLLFVHSQLYPNPVPIRAIDSANGEDIRTHHGALAWGSTGRVWRSKYSSIASTLRQTSSNAFTRMKRRFDFFRMWDAMLLHDLWS